MFGHGRLLQLRLRDVPDVLPARPSTSLPPAATRRRVAATSVDVPITMGSHPKRTTGSSASVARDHHARRARSQPAGPSRNIRVAGHGEMRSLVPRSVEGTFERYEDYIGRLPSEREPFATI